LEVYFGIECKVCVVEGNGEKILEVSGSEEVCNDRYPVDGVLYGFLNGDEASRLKG
jgi:uncharacterized metal-binding protein